METPLSIQKARVGKNYGTDGAFGLAVALLFCGCQTTGTANIRYPDGSTAELTFKKGVLDDMDIPSANPTTGRPDAYIRVGTSRVAAQTALEGYRLTGEALRKYMTDRAKEAAEQNVESR